MFKTVYQVIEINRDGQKKLLHERETKRAAENDKLKRENSNYLHNRTGRRVIIETASRPI